MSAWGEPEVKMHSHASRRVVCLVITEARIQDFADYLTG
jgi:hypothetical protein